MVDNGNEGMPMVVVRRKGMMWQHLNQHYSIWEVSGHGASISNMLTSFPSLRNTIVVQSARALVINIYCPGVQFPNTAIFFVYIINIKYNTVQLK